MHPGIIVGKGLAKFLVGGSVTRVAVKAIKANVPTPENKREKIRLAIATYTLSGILADQATQWIGKEIDEMVEWGQKQRDDWAKKKKEAWDKEHGIIPATTEESTEKPVETVVETTD